MRYIERPERYILLILLSYLRVNYLIMSQLYYEDKI